MTHRSDVRQRVFALAYAENGNAVEAMKLAGYKADPDGKNVGKLLGAPLVKTVLAQQALLASAETGITVADLVRDLDELRGVDIGDVFEDDGHGQPRMREWKTLSRAARRCIGKVKVTRRSRRTGEQDEDGKEITEDETITEVTLVDRLEVLQKMGNHLGAWNKDESKRDLTQVFVAIVPEQAKSAEEWYKQLPAKT